MLMFKKKSNSFRQSRNNKKGLQKCFLKHSVKVLSNGVFEAKFGTSINSNRMMLFAFSI